MKAEALESGGVGGGGGRTVSAQRDSRASWESERCAHHMAEGSSHLSRPSLVSPHEAVGDAAGEASWPKGRPEVEGSTSTLSPFSRIASCGQLRMTQAHQHMEPCRQLVRVLHIGG